MLECTLFRFSIFSALKPVRRPQRRQRGKGGVKTGSRCCRGETWGWPSLQNQVKSALLTPGRRVGPLEYIQSHPRLSKSATPPRMQSSLRAVTPGVTTVERRGSKVWKGRCAPRCNGGLRPPHAHKHHKIKPTTKIVQRAREHRLPVFTPPLPC